LISGILSFSIDADVTQEHRPVPYRPLYMELLVW
jgi:hypothetical protein